jgi:hypothetical protein
MINGGGEVIDRPRKRAARLGGPSSENQLRFERNYWPGVVAAFEAEFEASVAAVEAVFEASIAVEAELLAALASAATLSAAGAAGLLQAATESAPTAAPATSKERTKVEVMIPSPLG